MVLVQQAYSSTIYNTFMMIFSHKEFFGKLLEYREQRMKSLLETREIYIKTILWIALQIGIYRRIAHVS